MVSANQVENQILFLRGERVILDKDLAILYGVSTRVLNQAVRRNPGRFPVDFMFQLTAEEETDSLRSQIVILKNARGRHRKYLPYAFTEQGVAMLSSALRSARAVQVNVEIMRAFVRLRAMTAAHKDLARRLDGLEGKYDRQFKGVFDAIRNLMLPTTRRKRAIGFHGR
jgi:ORF6N domain